MKLTEWLIWVLKKIVERFLIIFRRSVRRYFIRLLCPWKFKSSQNLRSSNQSQERFRFFKRPNFELLNHFFINFSVRVDFGIEFFGIVSWTGCKNPEIGIRKFENLEKIPKILVFESLEISGFRIGIWNLNIPKSCETTKNSNPAKQSHLSQNPRDFRKTHRVSNF